jgi:hypothetical protein
MLKSEISGYHSGAAEDGSLLKCTKVMLWVQLPTFPKDRGVLFCMFKQLNNKAVL